MADIAASRLIDAGYAAMRVAPNPFRDKAPGVVEICSVSDCISHRPENWIQSWLHNDLGWFNDPHDALHPVPDGDQAEYRLFAYRIHPEFFHKGEAQRLAVPDNVRPHPVPDSFVVLGFDAVSKLMPSILGFECSPLSCNDLAVELPANEHCLFPTLDAAIAAARRFSLDQPEPGDYYVVEVLEGELRYAEPDISEFPADPPALGEPDMIDEYKEWAAHRYDPGHYLGGTIEPHLRKYALGKRGRKVAAIFLGACALMPLLVLLFRPSGSWERVLLAVWAVFFAAAAWRMTR